MATKSGTARGVVLSIGGSGSSGETFTPVAQLKSWEFSGKKWSFADVTNGDSPAVGPGVLEESIPNKLSPGEMALAGVYLPGDAGYLALQAAHNSGALTDFKVQLPKIGSQATSGNLYAFQAYVQDDPLPDMQFDKEMTFKTTLKLNSLITVTVGS